MKSLLRRGVQVANPGGGGHLLLVFFEGCEFAGLAQLAVPHLRIRPYRLRHPEGVYTTHLRVSRAVPRASQSHTGLVCGSRLEGLSP